MVIPAVIFFACVGAGVVAASRWLPDLAVGPVGGLAFFVVCGLLSAAFGLAGLHIYSIVSELNHLGSLGRPADGELLADGLEEMLWEVGSLFGLATAVYLLAPPAEVAEELAPIRPTSPLS
jgi:hypothetical protein